MLLGGHAAWGKGGCDHQYKAFSFSLFRREVQAVARCSLDLPGAWARAWARA
jgi:hypothetical protein